MSRISLPLIHFVCIEDNVWMVMGRTKMQYAILSHHLTLCRPPEVDNILLVTMNYSL